MRTYTLIFSIAAHVVAVCALLFTTVLATDDLPSPHDGSVFVDVVELPPPAPPEARPAVEQSPPPATVPVEAPVGVHAEVERPPIPDDVEPAPEAVVPGVGTVPAIDLREDPPPSPFERTPVRVGGSIKVPGKVVHVTPSYPAMARSARISGVVILEATIAEDGAVRDVRVLRSIPLLDQAAVDAVRQWRFTPTLLNGQPVPVLMTVTVAFNLD